MVPTSKDFTYTRTLFNFFGDVTNYCNLRECRLQVRHVSVIYRHGTHCSHKSYLTLLACDFEHVFATKQCNLCSTLRHKSWLTLPVMLYRFEIHSALELSRTALLGWPAASQPLVFARLLVGNYYYIIIIIIIIIIVIVIIITLRHIQ